MSTYPADKAPAEVLGLVKRLMPLLLQGDHPTLAILRQQFERCRLHEIDLSGAGFFAHFDVPADAPKSDPLNMTGGMAEIALSGVDHGAGCVLFVREGYLSMLEGFTYGEEWSENTTVLAVNNVVPIEPGAPIVRRVGWTSSDD